MKTTILPSLPSAERLTVALLQEFMPDLEDRLIDRIFSYKPKTMPFFVQVQKVPGRATALEATLVVDIDVFARDPDEAESRSLDIEGVLLGYPHVVRVDGRTVVIDSVTQNTGPAELPWKDDSVTRMGATYAIHIRRH